MPVDSATPAVEMLFKTYIADYVKPQSMHLRGNGKDRETPPTNMRRAAVNQLSKVLLLLLM